MRVLTSELKSTGFFNVQHGFLFLIFSFSNFYSVKDLRNINTDLFV